MLLGCFQFWVLHDRSNNLIFLSRPCCLRRLRSNCDSLLYLNYESSEEGNATETEECNLNITHTQVQPRKSYISQLPSNSSQHPKQLDTVTFMAQVLIAKGQFPTDHFVEQDAQGPKIRLQAVAGAAEDLRGHVIDLAAMPGQSKPLAFFCKRSTAEV